MVAEERQVEGRNLRNLQGQVWALLPGFCACARDVGEALPSIARVLGQHLAERPEARGHVLQALTLMVQTARSRKAPPDTAAAGGAGGGLALVPDAQAALETVGRFGKNFLPLLFNLHAVEPPEKRPAIQEAVRAVAGVTPLATLTELFTSMMRKLLEPVAAGATAASAAEAQRGLLDLLIAIAPTLSDAHLAMLWRAARPMLLSADVLLQKKAYKLVGAICAHHASWAVHELATLREALTEALPACPPGCKGKRLACLQSVTAALPPPQLAETLPSLLGEVVLATREVNVKTRAAAFDFLIGLAETTEKRTPGGAAAKAAAVRGLLVMVSGGLAGSSAHMMAATTAALGRLTYEMRERPALRPTVVQLFSTVIARRARALGVGWLGAEGAQRAWRIGAAPALAP